MGNVVVLIYLNFVIFDVTVCLQLTIFSVVINWSCGLWCGDCCRHLLCLLAVSPVQCLSDNQIKSLVVDIEDACVQR